MPAARLITPFPSPPRSKYADDLTVRECPFPSKPPPSGVQKEPPEISSMQAGVRAALRPAQTQRPWPAAACWNPLRLPPLPERRSGWAALSLLPHTAVRSARQQPLPQPPCRASPATQQIGDRISPCRQSNPTDRLFACRRRFAATAHLLKSFCQRFALVEFNVLPAKQSCPGAPYVIWREDLESPTIHRAVENDRAVSIDCRQKVMEYG